MVKSTLLDQRYRNLKLRARLVAAIRDFFDRHNYLEVETPLRIPTPIPEAHIDAVPSGRWYLAASPEQCMKRLLAQCGVHLYQICRSFRHGERGHRHLPEFTLLEWYHVGGDYQQLMNQCEDLIHTVAEVLGHDDHIHYQGQTISLTLPWDRITVQAAFDLWSPVDMNDALDTDRFDEIMIEYIEPYLGFNRPVFLYDYPAARASLAKLKAEDTTLAERFELYIAGLELCNGFSELSDPQEQRRRFQQERQLRNEGERMLYPYPDKFLSALGRMPMVAGNALGVDRLVMLLCDAEVIDQVVAFTPEQL